MILIISPRNFFAAERLKQELEIRNYGFKILSVEELAAVNFKLDIKQYTCLYIRNPYLKGSPKYIPQVINLAKKFKKAGKKVVDANITNGHLGEGKWKDYLTLKKAGVSIPQTILGAKKSYILHPKPYILKWVFGMKARGTFLIKSEKDLKKTFALHPKNEWMLQEYIEAEYEYKVVVVGYKALPVVLRFEFNKQFGRIEFEKHSFVNIETVKDLKNVAQKASKVLGRELCKVDVLEKKGKLYVLEVNRFPGLKSYEELTKNNAFKSFIEYLRK